MSQQFGLPTHEAARFTIPSLLASISSLGVEYAMLSILIVSFLLGLSYYLYHDYHAFIALGPGGSSQSISGYAFQVFLRLIIIRNTTTPGPIPAHLRNSGYLKAHVLPKRPIGRPKVVGIAPQRQLNQNATPEIYALLCERIQRLAADNPESLQLGTSCFEKHSTGLFSLAPANKTCKGEIVHAHPSDGSMHLTLHPADAKVVIEAGWGERHPLAKGGWCDRFVPVGFVMVYAPKDKDDLEMVMKIVEASWRWVSGHDESMKSGTDGGPFAHSSKSTVMVGA